MAISKNQPMRPSLNDCIDEINNIESLINSTTTDIALEIGAIKAVLPYSSFSDINTIKNYIDNINDSINTNLNTITLAIEDLDDRVSALETPAI